MAGSPMEERNPNYYTCTHMCARGGVYVSWNVIYTLPACIVGYTYSTYSVYICTCWWVAQLIYTHTHTYASTCMTHTERSLNDRACEYSVYIVYALYECLHMCASIGSHTYKYSQASAQHTSNTYTTSRTVEGDSERIYMISNSFSCLVTENNS